jgi:glutamyl-tRNA synthetase
LLYTKVVHVRFSPSPTGFLHVGGARTALYNWLFARHHGGTFSLRIEDTDRQRSSPEFTEDILKGLRWLGLNWDTGPIFQSQRLELYDKYIDTLLLAGKAYYSEEEGKKAVRFKMPHDTLSFKDLIRGTITFDASLIEDFVLRRADGFPTYNFACVVDDAETKITHIIRGDDHIANTPKQLALYNALGLKAPEFAHLPMILGEDGTRLSKRHGATAVKEYRALGYLSEALTNFIALLGWAPGGDRELISREEMIQCFTLEKVGSTSARFNMTKLDWMNSLYIRQTPTAELIRELKPFLSRAGVNVETLDESWLKGLVELYKERFKTLQDFFLQTSFFFTEEVEYEPETVDKFLKREDLIGLLQEVYEELSVLKEFKKEALEACLRGLVEKKHIGFGKLAQPLRVAITGRTVSAGLFETMELLGKEKTLKRLSHCLHTVCRAESI